MAVDGMSTYGKGEEANATLNDAYYSRLDLQLKALSLAGLAVGIGEIASKVL